MRGFTGNELKRLLQTVNKNASLQLPLIRDYIFPELDVYEEEIESSTHMFPFLVKRGVGLRGMSGTIFNKDTFPNMFDGNTTMSNTTSNVMMLVKQVSTPSKSSVTFDLFANEKVIATRIEKVLKEIHTKSKQVENDQLDQPKGDYRCKSEAGTVSSRSAELVCCGVLFVRTPIQYTR